jgi:hypothetical protein
MKTVYLRTGELISGSPGWFAMSRGRVVAVHTDKEKLLSLLRGKYRVVTPTSKARLVVR